MDTKTDQSNPVQEQRWKYHKPVLVERGDFRQNTEADNGPEDEEGIIWGNNAAMNVRPRE